VSTPADEPLYSGLPMELDELSPEAILPYPLPEGTIVVTIEQARKISELHQGVSSLVARKYVTTKIPIPYTALNAANNRNPRNSGLFFTLIFKEFQAAIASTRFSFTL